MTLEHMRDMHQALLEQLEASEATHLVDTVREFLTTVEQHGSVISAPQDRAYLRTLLRYWSGFVYHQTGAFPTVQLAPFDTAVSEPALSGATQRESLTIIEGDDLPRTQGLPADVYVHKPGRIPEYVDNYQIYEEIGHGGFSCVYRGRDTRDNTEVAIKLFSWNNMKTEALRKALECEQQAMQLEHPNILRMHAIAFDHQPPYVITEYIDAGSLGDRLTQFFWKPNLREILHILQQVASALSYLHAQHVVHRDVKPGNILLSRNQHAFLTDFGIAEIIGEVFPSYLIGTPEYMAPELIRRSHFDGRTDMYSLGVVMYELLAGKRPFRGSAQDLFDAHLNRSPPAFETDLPASVYKLIFRCLEKDSKRRPSAQEFETNLATLDEELSDEELDKCYYSFTSFEGREASATRSPEMEDGSHPRVPATISPPSKSGSDTFSGSNQMTLDPPIRENRKPTAEEERLVQVFAEIETKQLEFLDQAAKRIIELVTALLGVLFAVVAFGKDFLPPYLVGNPFAKFMSGVALVCYLGALLIALWAAQPRTYKHYHHNLTGMREELQQMIRDKARPLRVAGILFGLGSITLGVLIIVIILCA